MHESESIQATERLFEAEPYAREATARVLAVTDRGVVLDETIFYAESGGQPGDQGNMTTPDGRDIPVTDTQYLPGKLRIGHCIDGPAPEVGETVTLAIDWALRYRHMRMHTALHVLCGLMDAPVTGCAVHAERGRLDFDLPETTIDANRLDDRLQATIQADHAVAQEWRTGEEVASAMANRRSVKPPAPQTDRLRVVTVGDVDVQPCGGTHVERTGELAGLGVANIRKKSRHNRRVTVDERVRP